MIRIGFLVSLLSVLILGFSCKKKEDYPGTTVITSFTHGGIFRSFEVYTPESYDGSQAYPLLLVLHGRYGTGKASKEQYGMNAVAEEHGFIVVYPDGYEKSWNDGRGEGPAFESNIDDVGFIEKILDHMEFNYTINDKKVYTTGMSNGGFMSMRLGCELAHRFTAVGSVAATMAIDPGSWCSPSREMPVILIGGVADPIVPYNGGEISSGSFCVGFEDAFEFWKDNANCVGSESSELWTDEFPNDGTQIRMRAFTNCDNNVEVQLYEVLGGGHTWPGGTSSFSENLVGKLSLEMNASRTMAKFFLQFSLD